MNAEIRRVKEEKLMRSFVLASKNSEKAFEHILKISKKNKIDKLDISIEFFEKQVGIEDVRNIQKKLFLKPLRGKNKAFIINAINGITIESQNALLKILEEPPLSAYIFLIVQNPNLLLPTILSRCKTVLLEDEKEILTGKDISELEILIGNLSTKDSGFKLKLAQDKAGSREEALSWIEKAILGIRKILLSKIKSDKKGDIEALMRIIRKLEEGRYNLQNTNVNHRFILENILLSI